MAPGPKSYVDLISLGVTRHIHGGVEIGPSLFTAAQEDFRAASSGYDGDPGLAGRGVGHSYVWKIQRHDDGTADSVRLEPTDDGWIDQGGPTPRDFKAVLP